MSVRLSKLHRDRIYETLTQIILERTDDDPVHPVPQLAADSGGVILVKWPPIGDRQLVVAVSIGSTMVFWMRGGRAAYRWRVEPQRPKFDLISLVSRGWDWVQGGVR